MSKSPTQAQAVLVQDKVITERALDLNIRAIDTVVVRMPWLAGAPTLRATRTLLNVG